MQFKWLLICLCLYACKKKTEPEVVTTKDQFDIFLVAGQSNTLNGAGIVPGIDSFSGGIFQLGRHDGNDFRILEAIEPLEHWDKRPGKIGFGLTFAKLYKDSFPGNNRKVLLIPCGKGSSGFISNEWNKGDYLYEDAVKRINWVIANYPGSELRALLWHQGEHDVGNPDYQERLDRMVKDIRSDIQGWKPPQIFIAGGLVPYWARQDSLRVKQQESIRLLVNRIPFTGFADPEFPFFISKPDNASDQIHYDANGQRELGKRYFSEYTRLRK